MGDQDYTLILDGCYGVSGSIVYKNGAETEMGNVGITLTSTVETLNSTTDVTDGTFSFEKLHDNETYTFSGSTAKTHGGINSTDALGIILHTISNTPVYTGLELKAADVDGTNTVNATDALLVMQRFVQSVTTFSAGDWVFEDPSYNMTAPFANQKIYSLAIGDVNGSYTPNISESMTVDLVNNSVMQVSNGGNYSNSC